MSKPTNTIAQRIRQALDENRMSQQDLADKTGISKSSISQYLSGKVEPKQDRIYEIAKVLNVNPGWLMGFDADMAYQFRTGNSAQVRTLVEVYNQLNAEQQNRLATYAELLLSKQGELDELDEQIEKLRAKKEKILEEIKKDSSEELPKK